jgi:putative transposase
MITYKYKIYNSKRNRILNQKINIAGIIYNYCIFLQKGYYRFYKKQLSLYQLQKYLTKKKKLTKYSFWKNLNSQTIQDITERIDKSYKAFYRNVKKGIKSSPPKFKKVKRYKSITFKQTGIKIEGNKVYIQNKLFKFSKSRDFKGNIKQVIVKRNDLGMIFLYIITDNINIEIVESGKKADCGIDFGLKMFLTLSDNNSIESPLFFKENIKKVRLFSRRLSSKKRGSNNRYKAKYNLAKLHYDIANKRLDFQYKLAKNLSIDYDNLYFETLDIKSMQKRWGRKISDLGFYNFMQILEAQAIKYGCKITYIDKWFPSSKMCSYCGNVKKELGLKDRIYKCEKCGISIDRDYNASINIKREGASSLKTKTIKLSSKS